jgi:hypothetical protein
VVGNPCEAILLDVIRADGIEVKMYESSLSSWSILNVKKSETSPNVSSLTPKIGQIGRVQGLTTDLNWLGNAFKIVSMQSLLFEAV